MKKRIEISQKKSFLFLFLYTLFCFEPTFAEEKSKAVKTEKKPLWELGVGAFSGWLPDYPASDEYNIRSLGLPYVIYRGDILRIGGEDNRGAISGRFVKNERYEFDVSLSASFPVDSDNNDARRGMPDLDFLFEVGPQLIFKLINEPNRRKLNLNMQLRAAFSTDLSEIDSRGFVFNPKLTYRHENLTDWNINTLVNLGPIFATERLMDYFYEVKPRFATFERPAYDADAGYLGSYMTLGASKRFNKRFRFFVGTRFGIHNGSINKSSPLFKDKINPSIFAAFAWSFFQSERLEP